MDLLTKLATSAATGGVAYLALKALEETASPSAKTALAAWLQSTNLADDRGPSLHRAIRAFLFSYLQYPLRRGFFLVSCGVSVTGAVLLLPFWFTVFLSFKKEWLGAVWATLTSAALGILFGLLCDYLSLAKTSLLIRSRDFLKRTAAHYFLDVAISVVLALGWATLVFAAWEIAERYVGRVLGMDLRGLIHWSVPVSWIIGFHTFLTAMVPTLLSLAFVVSSIIAKVLLILGKPAQAAKSQILDIQSRPFQSVGILVSPVVTALTFFVLLAAF